jgi:putative ABC transport system ATP-binding protein
MTDDARPRRSTPPPVPSLADRLPADVCAIDIVDLHKAFGKLEVLAGIDLAIAPADVVCLIGPSGSGKSTLLNILGGLDSATSGSARFHEFELTEASPAELTRYRRASVGFIFQFFNLLPSLTARENVALITEI